MIPLMPGQPGSAVGAPPCYPTPTGQVLTGPPLPPPDTAPDGSGPNLPAPPAPPTNPPVEHWDSISRGISSEGTTGHGSG